MYDMHKLIFSWYPPGCSYLDLILFICILPWNLHLRINAVFKLVVHFNDTLFAKTDIPFIINMKGYSRPEVPNLRATGFSLGAMEKMKTKLNRILAYLMMSFISVCHKLSIWSFCRIAIDTITLCTSSNI